MESRTIVAVGSPRSIAVLSPREMSRSLRKVVARKTGLKGYFSKKYSMKNAVIQATYGKPHFTATVIQQAWRKRAVSKSSQAALQGDATSQYNLGIMYRDGRGCEQSHERAVEWWAKAAEQGNADARYQLGCAYNEGCGVPQSHERAIELFTLSTTPPTTPTKTDPAAGGEPGPMTKDGTNSLDMAVAAGDAADKLWDSRPDEIPERKGNRRAREEEAASLSLILMKFSLSLDIGLVNNRLNKHPNHLAKKDKIAENKAGVAKDDAVEEAAPAAMPLPVVAVVRKSGITMAQLLCALLIPAILVLIVLAQRYDGAGAIAATQGNVVAKSGLRRSLKPPATPKKVEAAAAEAAAAKAAAAEAAAAAAKSAAEKNTVDTVVEPKKKAPAAKAVEPEKKSTKDMKKPQDKAAKEKDATVKKVKAEKEAAQKKVKAAKAEKAAAEKKVKAEKAVTEKKVRAEKTAAEKKMKAAKAVAMKKEL